MQCSPVACTVFYACVSKSIILCNITALIQQTAYLFPLPLSLTSFCLTLPPSSHLPCNTYPPYFNTDLHFYGTPLWNIEHWSVQSCKKNQVVLGEGGCTTEPVPCVERRDMRWQKVLFLHITCFVLRTLTIALEKRLPIDSTGTITLSVCNWQLDPALKIITNKPLTVITRWIHLLRVLTSWTLRNSNDIHSFFL